MEGAGSHRPDVPKILVENHRQFLSFLTRRVGNASDAEEILQAAFVKGMEKSDSFLDDETAVAWFYRVLRNAVVDHYRHRDAERRALERLAEAGLESEVPGPDFGRAICQCVNDLLPILQDDHSALLRRVDLGGESIAAVAGTMGMTPNNTRVKLHRARKALRFQLKRSCGSCTEHGCLDCDCRRPA